MQRIKQIFTEVKEALCKKSNKGLMVYLIANFIAVWLIIGVFITEAILEPVNQYLYAQSLMWLADLLTLVLSLSITFVLYLIGLMTSLTPLGEWILRKQLRAKKIVTKAHKDRLYPIYNEVYQRVVRKYPEVSRDIELFITYDNVPNACAAGQHTIIVTTGLLALNDEQIKGILAHEFAHIVNKDTTLLLLTKAGNILFNIYAIIVTFFCMLFSNDEDGKGLAILIRFIFVGFIEVILNLLYLFALKSSRDNEYEADKFAARLGYGEYLIEGLNLIAQEHYARGIMDNLKATHPETNLRIATIEEVLDTEFAY